MLQTFRRIIETKKEWVLGAGLAAVVVATFWFGWGKMPMGDNTVELTYGLMAKAGQVPYRDFYVHVLPLTTYIAGAIEHTSLPIHLITILGVVNLLAAVAIVYGLGRVLRLSFWERVLGFLVLIGLYLTTLPTFNHHAFEVTLSGGTALSVLLVLQSTDRKKSWLYSALAALCAVGTFFLTQHIGLAAMATCPFVLLTDYCITRQKARLSSLYKVVVSEMVVMALFLSFFALAGISVVQMMHTAFFSAYGNYIGTYGYGTMWKSAADNAQHAIMKRIVATGSVPVVVTTSTVGGVAGSDFVPAGTILTTHLFDKIFLNKSASLYSAFTLVALGLIIVMVVHLIYLLIVQFRKKAVDPVLLVWVATLGTFLLASLLVYQINFSGFYFIIILWMYALRQTTFSLVKIVRLVSFGVVGLASAVLVISNLAIFHYEYATRQYFTSRTGNERVWLSPFYYHNFIEQFERMAAVVEQASTATTTFDAYPRASEVFYLLGKTPQKGTPMANFYHEGGHYQEVLSIATSSAMLVVFEPRFYGDALGDEHVFAMRVLQPALDTKFKLLLSSPFFKVYKRF